MQYEESAEGFSVLHDKVTRKSLSRQPMYQSSHFRNKYCLNYVQKNTTRVSNKRLVWISSTCSLYSIELRTPSPELSTSLIAKSAVSSIVLNVMTRPACKVTRQATRTTDKYVTTCVMFKITLHAVYDCHPPFLLRLPSLKPWRFPAVTYVMTNDASSPASSHFVWVNISVQYWRTSVYYL